MSLRLVFMGTPSFAVPTLDSLILSPHRILGVVTQPDRPKGRGRKTGSSAVKERALAAAIPVMEPAQVREEAFLRLLRGLEPDVVVVVAFGQILPRSVLDIPARGCFNIHASLLPKYRGAAPIAWAVLHGERVTGVTVIRMVERMDAGDILLAREVDIDPDEDAQALSGRLSRVGAELLMEVLRALEGGALTPVPQRDEEASLAPRLRKADGEIRWHQGADRIARQVRGLVPWPAAYTECRGKSLKVLRASARGQGTWGRPGEVLRADHAVLWVATGEGYLELEEVQLEGRPKMAASAFLLGQRDLKGEILGGQPSHGLI